jgi:hypothetical protein
MGQTELQPPISSRKNIDTDTAYLVLLQNNYLSHIQNPASDCYAVFTA